MPDAPITFDEIIAPLTRELFLSQFWNKSVLHQSGAKGRFSPLLSWDELSTILEWHCPPQPQLRLFQEGKQVDVRRYIDGQPGGFRLNAGGLIASLSQGATLVLDSVQEVAPRVRQLTEALQEILEGTTYVNLYAGWRKQTGFDLHWDHQDLIVLQLSGRKHWKVHGPSRLHPLLDDIEAPQKPTGAPLWDGVLEDGDMLHVPRGWWHMAYPLDEPSLHLTFSVEPANGADFLKWWMRKLLRHPQVRQNLPHAADAGARKDYLAGLLKLMGDGLAQDRVGEFLREQKAGRRALPRVRLPLAPIEQQKPLDRTTRLRLAVAQGLTMEREPGEPMAKLRANGRSWSFHPDLIPVFERLSSQTSLSVQDLCTGLHDPELIAPLMHALGLLADAGVILKEGPDSV